MGFDRQIFYDDCYYYFYYVSNFVDDFEYDGLNLSLNLNCV